MAAECDGREVGSQRGVKCDSNWLSGGSLNLVTKEDRMLTLNHSPGRDIIERHPCFSNKAHHKFGRIHLSVAPACNIQCRYCLRKYDCANESRPGVSSKVLTQEEALHRVRAVVERLDTISVIGIAGPGDALYNETTFKVMAEIHREYPELTLCVSTNGLLLADRLVALQRVGVKSITVTINAVTPQTAEKIYAWAVYDGKRYEDIEAAWLILERQWLGLRKAAQAGMLVKVNTVYIPGINEGDIPEIAKEAHRAGAYIMNLLPLIPQAEFSDLTRPSHKELAVMREIAGRYIKQMSHCRQCRADACGQLCEDRDLELETLNAHIGEQYCEMVIA